MARYTWESVIANVENTVTVIAILWTETFIMASGEKVRWKSMAAIGGKLLDPFTLGIGKKATDMALELYFLGRDIQKRQAYFNSQSGKKTVKFKKFNLHLSRNNYFVRHFSKQ